MIGRSVGKLSGKVGQLSGCRLRTLGGTAMLIHCAPTQATTDSGHNRRKCQVQEISIRLSGRGSTHKLPRRAAAAAAQGTTNLKLMPPRNAHAQYQKTIGIPQRPQSASAASSKHAAVPPPYSRPTVSQSNQRPAWHGELKLYVAILIHIPMADFNPLFQCLFSLSRNP